MTDKKKNVLIVFLILTSIILLCLLVISGKSNENQANTTSVNHQQVEISEKQSQEYQIKNDTSAIEKKNVCINFLKTYYSIQHSTSKNASITDCKTYLTENLYNSLLPAEDGTEQSQSDIDFTSSISVKDVYINSEDSEKLIARCTIKKTVNNLQSINEYFIALTFENINNEWRINSFDLISVQGEDI